MKKRLIEASEIIVMLAIGALLMRAGTTSSQRSYMIWDNSNAKVCPFLIETSSKTHLIAPLDDSGEPDFKHSTLEGAVVTYTPKCGRIEIRREKQ